MLRVRGVMLVPPENRAYRDFCARQKQYNQPLGQRTGFTAMHRLPYVLEKAARAHLEQSVPLMPQRILTYEQAERGRWLRRYREIDAVAGAACQPTTLFEVKVGHGRFARAFKQLKTSAEILEAGGKVGLALVVVFVRFDDDDVPLEELPADVRVIDDLVQLATVSSSGQRPLLLLSARQLWETAVASGQVADEALWNEARAEYFAAKALEVGRELPEEAHPLV